RDLNPRPSDYKSDALPAELRQRSSPPETWRAQTLKPCPRFGNKNKRLAQTEGDVQTATPPPSAPEQCYDLQFSLNSTQILWVALVPGVNIRRNGGPGKSSLCADELASPF